MADISPRLEVEAAKLMTTLEMLGDRLRSTMTVDVNEAGTPTRDWCRSLGHYRGGMQNLLAERREMRKLALMERLQETKQAHVFTEEAFAAEMKELRDYVARDLSDTELELEIKRRGIKVEVVDDDSGDDE